MSEIDLIMEIQRKFSDAETALEALKKESNPAMLYILEAKIHELGLVIDEEVK